VSDRTALFSFSYILQELREKEKGKQENTKSEKIRE